MYNIHTVLSFIIFVCVCCVLSVQDANFGYPLTMIKRWMDVSKDIYNQSVSANNDSRRTDIEFKVGDDDDDDEIDEEEASSPLFVGKNPDGTLGRANLYMLENGIDNVLRQDQDEFKKQCLVLLMK